MTTAATKLPFELKDGSLFHQQSFVGGKWIDAKSGKRFDVIDPGNDKAFASCPDNNADDVPAAAEASYAAFQKYSKVNPRQRAKWLLEWHRLIDENQDDLAKIVTHETGKPLSESYGEIAYAQGFTWFFAGEAERIQGTVQIPAAPGRRVFTIKQPVGPCVALVPWNFPIAMILRKFGAALAAGCTVICKPSPETPLSVLFLADLAKRAGFPDGVISILTTSLDNTPSLSEALCRHPLVKKVSFTGSTRVGKIIAGLCAENMKKCTLELGGNCPFIIFDDANLDMAVEQLFFLKWRHAGQACISANRVLVQSGVFHKVECMIAAKTAQLKMGHGAAEGTSLGPLTTPRSIDKIKEHIADATKNGARLVKGGNQPEKKPGLEGYFFEPTILSDMKPDMQASCEETFGPLLGLYKFETEAEAVKMANNTSMGLASYFFTRDASRVWRLYETLEAGMIGMNTGNQSAAESPFGGIKESGYGKESGIRVAVDEYCISKTGTFTVEDHF